jgi:hypothetical protein
MWTLDDRGYALAWQELDDDVCDGCGHPRSETLDPANEDGYTGHAVVCHACRAIALKTGTVSDRDGLRGYAVKDDDGG